MADINSAYGTSAGFNSTLDFDIATVHNKSSDRMQRSPDTNLPDISNVDTTQHIGYVKININDLDSFEYQVYNPNMDGECAIKDGIQRHVVYQATVTNCNVDSFIFPINNINNDYFVIVKPSIKKPTSNTTVSTRSINVQQESTTKYNVQFKANSNMVPFYNKPIALSESKDVALSNGPLRGSPINESDNVTVVQLEPIFKIFYASKEYERRLNKDKSAEKCKQYQSLMNDKFVAVTQTPNSESLAEMDQELDKLVSQRDNDDTVIKANEDLPKLQFETVPVKPNEDLPKLQLPPQWVPVKPARRRL